MTLLVIDCQWRKRLFAILFFTGVNPWIINIDGFAQIYADEIHFNRTRRWVLTMNGCGESFLTHSTDDRSHVGFSFPEEMTRRMEYKKEIDPYICTSQDFSCEQNGHGKASVKAVMRFCFGGGFRFDFRLPIFPNKESTTKQTTTTDDDFEFSFLRM